MVCCSHSAFHWLAPVEYIFFSYHKKCSPDRLPYVLHSILVIIVSCATWASGERPMEILLYWMKVAFKI